MFTQWLGVGGNLSPWVWLQTRPQRSLPFLMTFLDTLQSSGQLPTQPGSPSGLPDKP